MGSSPISGTTSEQALLVPIFLFHKKISHPLRCSSSFAKKHARQALTVIRSAVSRMADAAAVKRIERPFRSRLRRSLNIDNFSLRGGVAPAPPKNSFPLIKQAHIICLRKGLNAQGAFQPGSSAAASAFLCIIINFQRTY